MGANILLARTVVNFKTSRKLRTAQYFVTMIVTNDTPVDHLTLHLSHGKTGSRTNLESGMQYSARDRKATNEGQYYPGLDVCCRKVFYMATVSTVPWTKCSTYQKPERCAAQKQEQEPESGVHLMVKQSNNEDHKD